jgi:hypothetical protein
MMALSTSVASLVNDIGRRDIGTPVISLHTLLLDGLPIAAAGGEDGRLYVLEVPALDVHSSVEQKSSPITALQSVELDGVSVVFSGTLSGELAGWSVLPPAPLGDPVIV